jgi:hypothetical protein
MRWLSVALAACLLTACLWVLAGCREPGANSALREYTGTRPPLAGESEPTP